MNRTGAHPSSLPPLQTPLIFKTAAAFCAEYEPLAYVVEPIIRTSCIYTVTAKTGGGKTGFFVMLYLAVLTGRRDILDMDVEQGRVVYLAFENPDDVRMRMKVAAFALNIDLEAYGDQGIILDARAKPEDLVRELTLMTRSGPFMMVLLDTLAAGFDGKNVNDPVEGGEYLRRLRPVTLLRGLPVLVIAAHPIKNANEEQLVPYGAGAFLNEVDGNLTLAKKGDSITVLHHQGKYRGLEFAPRAFRFDFLSSPDVVDRKGRQVTLPIVRPVSAETVEIRKQQEVDKPIAILRALAAVTKATHRDLAAATGISKSSVERHTASLAAKKLVEADLGGGFRITPKGRKELEKLS